MKGISGLLNDVQLEHWLRAGEPLARSDGGGLTFTVSGAGMAAWVLRFRHGNRRHELTLGRYPDLSLAKAREEAAVRRVDILKGVNPAAEKHKAKVTAAKGLDSARADPRLQGETAAQPGREQAGLLLETRDT